MNCNRFASMVGVIFLTIAAQATVAQEYNQGNVSLEEFQGAMQRHIDMVGSPGLKQRFADLDFEQWQTMFDCFPDKRTFIDAAEAMESLNIGALSTLQESSVLTDVQVQISALLAAQLFAPAYPTGGNYNTFTATLPGLGMLNDSADVGTETGTALNDERCDTNGEGGARIALATLRVAAEIGNTACNSTPSPFEPAVCIPAGVLNEVVIADEIVLDQCEYQTALVDSAEIEAAFENSVQAIGTVNNIDIVVNDETNFTSDAELAIVQTQLTVHDADIKNNLNIHDTDIKNDLSTHDTDIKSQLSTHDADVKTLLVALQGSVDILLARQLEVIRLLHTPQGQRNTTVPACEGAGCDFPDK